MKKKGQVFTPQLMVNKLLEIAEIDENIHSKRLLENSCGDGNILLEVVKCYIKSARNANINDNDLKNILENKIWGFEIDEKKMLDCVSRLNDVSSQFGLIDVQWKIINEDFLKYDFDVKFDYIIGNPPYISYKDLSAEVRVFIKKKFETCKNGKPDYCYPFIEKSIELLALNGTLVYLVPMSIFRNVYAVQLREYMKNDIVSLNDFSNIRVFSGVTVASSIFKLIKGSNSQQIHYKKEYTKFERNIDKQELREIWNLAPNKRSFKNRIGNRYSAQNSVATLRNNIFVFSEYTIDEHYLYYGTHRIEKELVYPASSPKGHSTNTSQMILFPYKLTDETKISSFTEVELQEKYPNAYKYLKDNFNELNKRSNDSKSQWFEYGRNQAIRSLWRRKLLISKVVTSSPKTYILEKDCIPYSGIFIYEKENATLEQLKQIIESENFYNYVCDVGTSMNGNSVQISTKIIEDYTYNWPIENID